MGWRVGREHEPRTVAGPAGVKKDAWGEREVVVVQGREDN